MADELRNASAINRDGMYMWRGRGLCVVSIGSYVQCRDGHKGYVRAINYTMQMAWVSDGDGAREVRFCDILIPK